MEDLQDIWVGHLFLVIFYLKKKKKQVRSNLTQICERTVHQVIHTNSFMVANHLSPTDIYPLFIILLN